MTRIKLASIFHLLVTILTFLSARLKEPTTRAALIVLLGYLGLDGFVTHIDAVTALVTAVAVIVAVPEAAVTDD